MRHGRIIQAAWVMAVKLLIISDKHDGGKAKTASSHSCDPIYGNMWLNLSVKSSHLIYSKLIFYDTLQERHLMSFMDNRLNLPLNTHKIGST